jgi:ABC-type tungstate transport system permease subunit
LSDEPTFRHLESTLDLVSLYTDKTLIDPYAVISPTNVANARRLTEWLTGMRAQQRIANHEVNGFAVFHAWPEQCAGTDPVAQLCTSSRTP